LNGLISRGLRPLLLVLSILLSACASPPAKPPAVGAGAHWQGRLAVKVFSTPVQAFSADFDLQGSPTAGELTLTSPLGASLARMQWTPTTATLNAQGQARTFDSIQELARQITGADLPVTSLFAWLEGRNEAAEGWQVDLQELAQGRIQAHHVEAVKADLKIILDR